MANNEDNKGRGFSGLGDLADDAGTQKTPPPDRPSRPKQRPQGPESRQPQSETQSRQEQSLPSENRTASASQGDHSTSAEPPPPTSGGNKAGWIWLVLIVGFIAWAVIQDSGKKRSPPTYDTLVFSEPPVGRNNVLNSAQIRWCVRENIRIDTLASWGESYVSRRNALVGNYNQRCGEYRYRSGSLERARKDVAPFRREIIQELRTGRYRSPSSSSSSSFGSYKSPSSVASNATSGVMPTYPTTSQSRASTYVAPTATPKPKPKPSESVRAVQKRLNELGYEAGPADGFMGPQTRAAIKAFEQQVGRAITGQVSEGLIAALRMSSGSNLSSTSPILRSSPTNSNLPYFTRGSSLADVQRLQGAPREISEFSSEEWWYYGYSKVVINKRGKTVIAWDNQDGNLRVRYQPGSRTTSGNYYTRGSHQDDVLRVQGTPKSISMFSDEEWWYYGYSKVVINKRGTTVIAWDNQDGNLRVRYQPGSRTTSGNYYTRGSHQDDVLRVQGTPKSISMFSDEEWWYYGYSKVVVNKRSKTVRSWDNTDGNLRVR